MSFFRALFNPRLPDDVGSAPHSDQPVLAPVGNRAAPGVGKQLPLAMAQIAEHIAEREVRDLQDSVECRFQVWTLTIHLTPANQPMLRNLIDINQRNDGVAKTIVERGMARAESAKLLNLLRLKIEFKRAEGLPVDSSEVLLMCGHDSIELPFSYTGQIELTGAPAAQGGTRLAESPAQAHAGASGIDRKTDRRADGNNDGNTDRGFGDSATLLLWAQLPGQAAVRRWRFTAGPLKIGAADDASLLVDHRHVSGDHLAFTVDAQGRWQVEDHSRNGSNLIDATAPDGTDAASERPLPTRAPQPLPRAGALRLGPLPEDPLLHFHVVPAPRTVAAAAQEGVPPARRRATELASVPTETATPARRATGLL